MIDVEEHGELAVVTLNRPPVNALDTELLRAIADTFVELDRAGVRGIVLTGSGRALSAGVDLKHVLEIDDDGRREFLRALVTAFETVFRFPRPVVAAVNGHALAGGCIFVSACDRRLMAEGVARIGVTELRVGVAFPVTALEILRFAVGHARAVELVLTAEAHQPPEALELGLVDQVVRPGELVALSLEEAARLAAIPERTFAITKRQLRREAIAAIETHRDTEDAMVEEVWLSDEVRGAIRLFLEQTVGGR